MVADDIRIRTHLLRNESVSVTSITSGQVVSGTIVASGGEIDVFSGGVALATC